MELKVQFSLSKTQSSALKSVAAHESSRSGQHLAFSSSCIHPISQYFHMTGSPQHGREDLPPNPDPEKPPPASGRPRAPAPGGLQPLSSWRGCCFHPRSCLYSPAIVATHVLLSSFCTHMRKQTAPPIYGVRCQPLCHSKPANTVSRTQWRLSVTHTHNATVNSGCYIMSAVLQLNNQTPPTPPTPAEFISTSNTAYINTKFYTFCIIQPALFAAAQTFWGYVVVHRGTSGGGGVPFSQREQPSRHRCLVEFI